eukprot:2295725-Prorocentrum_lima.AAC.1
MTSSLVGSEMCIRDRLKTAIANVLSGSDKTSKAHAWWGLCAPGCAPVSYTHLTLPTICSV